MKVLLINGSPRKECTYTALKEVADALEAEGIGTEIITIGNRTIAGCSACKSCKKTGRCIIDNDPVHDIVPDWNSMMDSFSVHPFTTPAHRDSYRHSWTDCSTHTVRCSEANQRHA